MMRQTFTETVLMRLPIPASRLLLGVDNTSNPHHKKDSLRNLNPLWGMFEHGLKLRSQIIWHEMTLYISAMGCKVPPRPLDKHCIIDLDMQPSLASQIASVISSCSPSFLAEIREWQRVWHIATFIREAMEVLSKFMRAPRFPFCDDLCDAMVAMAFTFPPPRGTLSAEQRPDDRDRVMDHYTCFDDPLMRDFISSLGDIHRNFMNTQLDMFHKRLPAFPPSFRIWDTIPGHNLSVHGILGRDEKKAPRLWLKIPKCLPRPSAREHKYKAF